MADERQEVSAELPPPADESPELLRQQMDDTRNSLSQKVELETK